MKKRILTFVLICITMLGLSACGTTENIVENTEKENGFTELTTSNDCTTGYGIYDYRDPETGVHYLLYYGYKSGGVTVRYNTDGSIYVD